jgi:glycosyltransferase involved in cell wall biosynthesis
MKTWLFIGPRLLAGIGQVTNKYCELVKSLGHKADYVQFGDPVPSKHYDVGFAFVLPINLDMVDNMLSGCVKKMYMTVCETLTVHESYGIIPQKFGTVWVPSQFCLDVLSKQFPYGDWRLLPHWTPTPDNYVFYTIGNVLDPRKNIKMLLEAFMRLRLPNAKLLIKATCKEPVHWKFPNVTIINELLDDLEPVHSQGDCYVNCSRSEGVGMGAVEAAIREKPVILTDFGGLKEYIPDSPFVVHCEHVPMKDDDFLYQKGMIWGEPSLEELMKHMKTCYDGRIRTWKHPGTRKLIDSVGHLLCDQ